MNIYIYIWIYIYIYIYVYIFTYIPIYKHAWVCIFATRLIYRCSLMWTEWERSVYAYFPRLSCGSCDMTNVTWRDSCYVTQVTHLRIFCDVKRMGMPFICASQRDMTHSHGLTWLIHMGWHDSFTWADMTNSHLSVWPSNAYLPRLSAGSHDFCDVTHLMWLVKRHVTHITCLTSRDSRHMTHTTWLTSHDSRHVTHVTLRMTQFDVTRKTSHDSHDMTHVTLCMTQFSGVSSFETNRDVIHTHISRAYQLDYLTWLTWPDSYDVTYGVYIGVPWCGTNGNALHTLISRVY